MEASKARSDWRESDFSDSVTEEVGGVTPVPYVASIEENGTIEFPNERETHFKVGFEFDITGMEEILVEFEAMEISRSIGVWFGCSQAVGTTGIE